MSLVAVVGMHRSGTSAVAQLCAGLGVRMGDRSELLGPAPENPEGFWEHRGAKQVNERILRELGGDWRRLPALRRGWERTPELDPLRAVAREVVARLQDDGAVPAGFKDPRTSLTLPFWATVASIGATVHVLRDPREVTASLAARNGLDPEESAALWCRYVLAVADNAPDALVIHHARLLRDPVVETARLAGHLGLQEPDPERVADSVRPEFHRSRPVETFDGVFAGLALHVHEQLVTSGRVDETLVAAWQALVNGEHLLEEGSERLQLVGTGRLAEQEQALVELAERHRAEVRKRQEVVQSLDAARQREAWLEARLRRETFEVEVQLADAREQVAAARRTAERIERQHRRLRNRRAVRVALRVADRAGPLVRLVRRTRGGAASEPAASSSPVRPAPSTGPAEVVTPMGTPLARVVPRPARVSIIVPVHDAVEHVARCLEALERNTTRAARLIVIDDASRDPAVSELLGRWEGRTNVVVARNDDNLGFTRTVNRGLGLADPDDVVILNSDTVVPPRWLENLVSVAASDPRIGTVTPLSDNAGAFSAPDLDGPVPVPEGHDPDGIARWIAQSSFRRLPQTPTGSGFCLYVRRDLLRDTGPFDEEAFPRGYGEENDLCMRADRLGWRHVVDDRTYVWHARQASFGSEKEELLAQGRRVLDERYPDYTQRARAFASGDAMGAVRSDVRAALDRLPPAGSIRPRVLYVLHASGGGTPATTRDLVDAIEPWWDPLLLESDGRELRLFEPHGGELRTVAEQRLPTALRFGQATDPAYERWFGDLLDRHHVELVHVRHLIRHTFDPLLVAAARDVPTVLSFHDYFFVCPTTQLLDQDGRFCGGACTPGQGTCVSRMDWIDRDLPHLKHGYVHEWRRQVGAALATVDAFVTTSGFSRDLVRDRLALPPAVPFEVIEHGRDLEPRTDVVRPPRPGGPVRIVVPGNISRHKGTELLRQLRSLDRGQRLEIHVLGKVSAGHDLGPVHGPYDRDDVGDWLKRLGPAFGAVLSPWGETWCHTLTELWTAGVPAIVADVGAIGERARRHGGAVLVPPEDAEAAYRAILEVADDPDRYSQLVAEAGQYRAQSTREMAGAYADLYAEVIAGRRAFAGPGVPGAGSPIVEAATP